MPAKRYYLDWNATTPLREEVREAMLPWLGSSRASGTLGNASSLHAEGRRARAAVDSARDDCAAWLRSQNNGRKVSPSEIVFTSGGTESNNLAVQGIALAHTAKGRHIVTCATEHHAVLQAAEALRDRQGFDLTILGVDAQGCIRLDDLRGVLTQRPDTTLVSIMSANNETGTRQPLAKIGAVCAEHDVFFHTDAVQSAGKEPLPLDEWGVSALSLTAHKCGGPVGAGLLYLRAGIPVARLMEGGAHENERRPGTENVPAIVGLAKALALTEDGMAERAAREHAQIELLWSLLEPLGDVYRNGHADLRAPNTLNVSFDGLDGEEFLIALDLAGLSVSSGSACLVGSVQRSHVLAAMGSPGATTGATIRISIGPDLTEDDIADIARRIERVVALQRRVHSC